MVQKIYTRQPRACQQCGTVFTPKHRGKAGEQQKFCTYRCNLLWQHRYGHKAHNAKPGIEATLHPTTLDLAWAAGIYEGEGSVTERKSWKQTGKKYFTQQVHVGQKDRWLCDRLRDLFGGYVSDEGVYKKDFIVGHRNHKGEHRGYSWNIHGPRARGFLMTIYKFLSPRRQRRIREMLTNEQMAAQTEIEGAAPTMSPMDSSLS